MKVTDTCDKEETKLKLTDIKQGDVFECWGPSGDYRGTYVKTSNGGAVWLESGIYYNAESFYDTFRLILLPNAQLVKGKK